MKSTQIIEESLRSNMSETPQIIYIFVREMQIFDVFDDLFQTGTRWNSRFCIGFSR